MSTTTTTDPSQPAGWPTQPPRRRWGRKILLTIAACIAGLFLIGAIFGNSDQPNTTEPQHSGISKGLGSADAAGDVDKIRVNQPDAIGVRYGFVQVTNHSKGTSDYSIELRVLDSSGVNVGTAYASADRVEPGQTAKATFMVTEDGADRVEITKLQRTASS
jgi:hypothetical protein